MAEISPVQNETDFFIAIPCDFTEHGSKLWYVVNTPRIGFVKEWFFILKIISNGIVDDSWTDICLGMTEFSQFNLSGLAVLIRRIIGNINTLPSISLCIPFIQKACTLILGDALKEITYRRITTFPFAVVLRIGKWSVCCSLSRSFSIVTCSPLQLNVSNAIVLLFTARTVTVNFLWVELQKKERVSALSLETCIQIFILFEDHDSTAKQENHCKSVIYFPL